MSKGQTLSSTQTPIASDSDIALSFVSGLDATIKGSKEAYPKEVDTSRIGEGSKPRKGVWGTGFQKP